MGGPSNGRPARITTVERYRETPVTDGNQAHHRLLGAPKPPLSGRSAS